MIVNSVSKTAKRVCLYSPLLALKTVCSYAVHRAVVGYTPNARCAHAMRRTKNGQAADRMSSSCPSSVRQHTITSALKRAIVNDKGTSDTAIFTASDVSDNLKRLL